MPSKMVLCVVLVLQKLGSWYLEWLCHFGHYNRLCLLTYLHEYCHLWTDFPNITISSGKSGMTRVIDEMSLEASPNTVSDGAKHDFLWW